MTNRVILGNLGGGVYGLKVSRDGIDVLTANDDELMFDSSRNNIRIIMTGSIPYVADSAPAWSKIQDVDVVLPILDYEPSFFAAVVSQKRGPGGVFDPSGEFWSNHGCGRRFETLSNSDLDYITFEFNLTTSKVRVNSRFTTDRDSEYIDLSNNYKPVMRYCIFSNRFN